MRIAVTGATGHLGANVCRVLVNKGYEVVALYHRSKSTLAIDELNVKIMQGDIMDKNFVYAALQKVDKVIHCAAKISIDGDKEGKVMECNVIGVRNVVNACLDLGIKRLVHIASVHMFKLRNNVELLDEQGELASDSDFIYNVSKKKGYQEIQKAVTAGLNAVVLCPTGIIGPFDFKPSRLGKFFINLYLKKLPSLVIGSFYWIDARDVAQVAINALDKGHSGNKYLLGGTRTSIKELAQIASSVAQKDLMLPTVPYWLAFLGLPFLKTYSYLLKIPLLYTYESIKILKDCPQKIDSTKASTDLNFKPRPLKETIKDTVEWFKVNNYLD